MPSVNSASGRRGPAPDEATCATGRGAGHRQPQDSAQMALPPMATLAHLKIDPQRYRVLTGTNISQTWQFVDTGNTKLGFVAWANLVEAGKTGEAWAVPASFYPPSSSRPWC